MRSPPSLAVLLFSIASTSCRGITHNHTSHTSARVSVPHKPTVSGTSSVTHKSSAATANRTAPSKRSSGPQPSAKRPPPPPPPAPEEEEDAGDARPALLTIVAVTLAPLCASVSIKALCEDTGEGTTSSWVFACLLITAFLGLNSGLSILNRWALGVHGLRFPLIMTAMHMLFGSCALSPLMLLHKGYYVAHRPTLSACWKSVALIGALNGLQIAANNASLTRIELSLNQVLRAFGPLCVAILAVCVERKYTPCKEAAWLCVIACGVGMTVYKEASRDDHSFFGAVLVLASIFMQSGILSLSAILMGKVGVKLDGLQMAFYSGPSGCLVLIPFALAAGEGATLRHALRTEPAVTTTFLLGSSVLAVAYNAVVFQSSHTLSSVGTSVLANVKIVILFVLSALTLGEMASWRVREYVGCVLTFGGSAVYSYIKVKAKEEAAARKKAQEDLEAEAATLKARAVN